MFKGTHIHSCTRAAVAIFSHLAITAVCILATASYTYITTMHLIPTHGHADCRAAVKRWVHQ